MREALINRILHISPGQVLNSAKASADVGAGTMLAEELRRSANAFKAEAIDETGAHVDYARLRESPAYQAFRQTRTPMLRRFDPGSLNSRNEQLAFWINLYNVLVLDAVIDFKVEASVAEGPRGLLTFFRRAAYEVGSQRLNLEDIEHGLLRGNAGHPFIPGRQFGPNDPRTAWVVDPMDARVHFALNCASRSCPPIAVYEGGAIDRQLDLAARSFIYHDVEIDEDHNKVELSSLFKWYAKDFDGQDGILDFVQRHLPADDERYQWLKQRHDQVQLVFKPYDWSLNS